MKVHCYNKQREETINNMFGIDLIVIISILLVLSIGGIIAGAVLMVIGKHKKDINQQKGLKKTGLIILLVDAGVATLSSAYVIYRTGFSFGFGFLIFATPFLILIGIIASLAIGIPFLMEGYATKNKVKIKVGWVLLITHTAVVTAIITLLILFMSGLIPISLM